MMCSKGDWLLCGGRALAVPFGRTMDGAVVMLRLRAGNDWNRPVGVSLLSGAREDAALGTPPRPAAKRHIPLVTLLSCIVQQHAVQLGRLQRFKTGDYGNFEGMLPSVCIAQDMLLRA